MIAGSVCATSPGVSRLSGTIGNSCAMAIDAVASRRAAEIAAAKVRPNFARMAASGVVETGRSIMPESWPRSRFAVNTVPTMVGLRAAAYPDRRLNASAGSG